MAKQVRPWSAKPEVSEAPRVRVSDRGVDQQNPSGTASRSRRESPNVRVQSLPSSRHQMRVWQAGGVHVRSESSVRTSSATRPRAVTLHFVRCDQLTAGLTPAGGRPCWAHKQKKKPHPVIRVRLSSTIRVLSQLLMISDSKLSLLKNPQF